MGDLSPNFSVSEMSHSDTAIANGLDNTPSPAVVERLRFLCTLCLEPIRDLLGVPLKVTSGYRSEEVNQLISSTGSKSQHIRGEACDFVPIGVSIDDAYIAICNPDNGIMFDQCIHEDGRWIHVSYVPDRELRRECLRMKIEDGKQRYFTYAPR